MKDDEIMERVGEALNTLDKQTTDDLKTGRITVKQAQDKYDTAREKRRK